MMGEDVFRFNSLLLIHKWLRLIFQVTVWQTNEVVVLARHLLCWEKINGRETWSGATLENKGEYNYYY